MSGWKNHGRYWWPYRWLVELFSAETDSMMSRLGFGLHNFGPLALLIATSGEFMSLTTPSSLSMVQKIGPVITGAAEFGIFISRTRI
jgi:hypothetical protein